MINQTCFFDMLTTVFFIIPISIPIPMSRVTHKNTKAFVDFSAEDGFERETSFNEIWQITLHQSTLAFWLREVPLSAQAIGPEKNTTAASVLKSIYDAVESEVAA